MLDGLNNPCKMIYQCFDIKCKTGLDAEKLKLVQDLEIEMMTDMYARLTNSCHKKCVPPKYHEVSPFSIHGIPYKYQPNRRCFFYMKKNIVLKLRDKILVTNYS